MNRYITRGIDNNLPIILQQQLWKLVAQREHEQFDDNESLDYFHIFQFNMHNDKLCIKHKQEISINLSISIRSTLFVKMM